MSEAADRLAQRIRAAMGDHNSDDLPVTQCVINLRKEVVALQAQLSEARANRDALLISGTIMSNACFNLSQWDDRLPEGQAGVLKELQENWDRVVRRQAEEPDKDEQQAAMFRRDQ